MVILRAHHLMCIQGYPTKGYTPEFVDNFWEVAKKVNNNPDQKILVTAGVDDTCTACPFNDNHYCIKKENDGMNRLDHHLLRILKIREGQVIKARDLNLKYKKDLEGKCSLICHWCEWKNHCSFFKNLNRG